MVQLGTKGAAGSPQTISSAFEPFSSFSLYPTISVFVDLKKKFFSDSILINLKTAFSFLAHK